MHPNVKSVNIFVDIVIMFPFCSCFLNRTVGLITLLYVCINVQLIPFTSNLIITMYYCTKYKITLLQKGIQNSTYMIFVG